MTKLYLILSLIIISGCSRPPNKLGIEVRNNEVYFIHPVYQNYNPIYKTQGDKEKSETIITFTLSNNTSKKTIFIFDKTSIRPTRNIRKEVLGEMAFVIKDQHNFVKFQQPIIEFSDDIKYDSCRISQVIDKYRKLNERYKKIGIIDNIESVDNFINRSFVINPNEKKTFKVVVNLPIITESNPIENVSPEYYENLQNGQMFQLYYSCDAKALRKVLPKYLIDELKNNDTEIFDGILLSNPVPLKMKE